MNGIKEVIRERRLKAEGEANGLARWWSQGCGVRLTR